MQLLVLGGLVFLLAAPVAQAGPTPAQKCASGKNGEAGKYAFCRQKAESKFATTGDGTARATAFQKCLDKLASKWPGLEAKAVAAGGACPSVGDQAAIQGFIDTHTSDVAAALAGGPLPDCPGDLAACQSDLLTCSGTLSTTQVILGTCQIALTATQDDLATCTSDLATCQATPRGQRLQTGQTTCWDASGGVIPCAGTGQDGALQKGRAPAYVDNGDGTITDLETGLMWEKKDLAGGVHDLDNTHTWTNAFAVHAAALNAMQFAGFADWRVPNANELQSLVNYGVAFPGPVVDPIFHAACVGGCSVLTCSCAASAEYWSSTTDTSNPAAAWMVEFLAGNVRNGQAKSSNSFRVRAVRGGS